MKILMLLEKDFPPDPRVEKEALSLIEEGYEVHIASVSSSKNFEETEKYKSIYLHRKYQGFLMKKFSATSLILPFYFWWWNKYVNDLFKTHKFDAIHVHDLPLSKVGFKMSKKYNAKLICDQHEYYSNWIVKTAHYNTFLGKIVKKLSNWRQYEKRYLNKADLVITVEEPLRQCYIREVGVAEEKIICVPNTSRKTIFNYDNVDYNVAEKYKDKFVIFYAGGITKLKNIDTAIEALPFLKEKIPNILLLFAAKISKYADPLGKAKKSGVYNLVEYAGYIPHEKIPSYIAASDICFHVPRLYNEEVNRTIQTKIYQYLLMYKPIVVGQAKMAKNFVEKNNIGLAIKQSDPQDFAKKILKLKENPNLYAKIQENCKKVAKQNSWENTIIPMLNRYKTLLYE